MLSPELESVSRNRMVTFISPPKNCESSTKETPLFLFQKTFHLLFQVLLLGSVSGAVPSPCETRTLASFPLSTVCVEVLDIESEDNLNVFCGGRTRCGLLMLSLPLAFEAGPWYPGLLESFLSPGSAAFHWGTFDAMAGPLKEDGPDLVDKRGKRKPLCSSILMTH